MRLAWFPGKVGNMRNAIPRDVKSFITVPADEEADVLDYVKAVRSVVE